MFLNCDMMYFLMSNPDYMDKCQCFILKWINFDFILDLDGNLVIPAVMYSQLFPFHDVFYVFLSFVKLPDLILKQKSF